MIDYLATISVLVFAKPEVLAGLVECALRVGCAWGRESRISVVTRERTKAKRQRRISRATGLKRKRRTGAVAIGG